MVESMTTATAITSTTTAATKRATPNTTPSTSRRSATRRKNTAAKQRRQHHEAILTQAVGDRRLARDIQPLITQIDFADGSVIATNEGNRRQHFFLLYGRVMLSNASAPIAVLPEASIFGDEEQSIRPPTSGVQALALGPVTIGVMSGRDYDTIVHLLPEPARIRHALAREIETLGIDAETFDHSNT